MTIDAIANPFEVYDPAILARARAIIDADRAPRAWAQAVIDAVRRNEGWRGQRCVNLLAPEAPTNPTVRALYKIDCRYRYRQYEMEVYFTHGASR